MNVRVCISEMGASDAQVEQPESKADSTLTQNSPLGITDAFTYQAAYTHSESSSIRTRAYVDQKC